MQIICIMLTWKGNIMGKKMNCTLEVKDYTSKSGFSGKSLVLVTPKGVRINLGGFNLNSKLVYKVICEIEGK